MARARNIKPGFFKNEVLGVADPLYSLLFEGLWVLADREGRLEDRPLRIKGEVFPYRDGLNVDAMLNWLESNGFIQRYTAHGKKCILVLEFVKHQNPHKNEAESELPAPSTGCTKPEEIGTTTEIIGSTRADSLSSDSLIPDSQKSAGEPATSPVPEKQKSRTVTLAAYLDTCKALGVKAIPNDHHIRRYCADAGITDEMTAIAWLRFREEHTTGARKAKRYIDWPETFANCVKSSWYGLWACNAEGPANWTTKGLQEKRVADARRAEKEAANEHA